MYRSFFPLPLSLLFIFACQNAVPPTDDSEIIAHENTLPVRYSPSDIQKMHWLAGAWKGAAIRQSFQFHGGDSLEILLLGKDGKTSISSFVWENGRYYYGQYRQWVVTWIGEKDVRFDPLRPGLTPMTWTRLSDQKWHFVKHLPGGDDITVMERVYEMQP